MSHSTTEHKHHGPLIAHIVLGAIFVTGGLTLVLYPSWWPFIATAAAIGIALHIGSILIALGASVLAVSLFRRRIRQQIDGSTTSVGVTISAARFYDGALKILTLGRERRMRELILDVAGVRKGDHVLDVGCGTGTLALSAATRVGAAGSVQGVDAAEEMVARAKSKAQQKSLPISFQVAPAQKLPFATHSFDVVFCTLVLHHLPVNSRVIAAREMRRVLKPGGRLVVVEIGAIKGMWAALNPIALLHGHDAKQLLADIEQQLTQVGFTQIETAPLGFGVLARVVAR